MYTVAKADPKAFLTFSYVNLALGLLFMLIFIGSIVYFYNRNKDDGKI